jgi:hypothetical protein
MFSPSQLLPGAAGAATEDSVGTLSVSAAIESLSVLAAATPLSAGAATELLSAGTTVDSTAVESTSATLLLEFPHPANVSTPAIKTATASILLFIIFPYLLNYTYLLHVRCYKLFISHTCHAFWQLTAVLI